MKPSPGDITWTMTVNARSGLKEAIEALEFMFLEHGYLDIEIQAGKQRTQAQNNSLHLWLEWLAEDLNDAGYDTKAVLAVKQVGVPWTKASAKELLWRPLQEAMISKTSTTEAERPDYEQVERVLTMKLQEMIPGLAVRPWPKKKDDA